MSTETSNRPRGRKWLFRLFALLLPFVLLVLLEAGFRLTGVGAEDPWENRHVHFVTGERFFPQWDDTVAMPKPEGTTRIFVFGGSAVRAYRMQSFVDRLPEELAARVPGRTFEVINGGMVAFGSHRVYEVMKEATEFDPDLLLVYFGHNEFLEEIFFDPDGFLARQEEISKAVSELRVIRWIRGMIGGGPIEIPRPNVQRHFLGNENFPLIKDERQYGLRLDFLTSNVRQMIRLAREREIRIVLSPAIPNILYPPRYPVHGPGYDKDADAWDTAMAAKEYERAMAIDDAHALLVFRTGLAELSAKNRAGAKEWLVRAVGLDRGGDRANSDVARVILAEAEAHAVPFIDVRDLIFDRVLTEWYEPGGEEGDFTYLDHCHFTAEGHAAMARHLADGLAPLLRKE